MKKIFYFFIALSSVCLTSSCDDGPKEEPLDPSVPIYQEYEVDFYDSGITNVFANFRKNNSAGESVKLNNGASILVNGGGMSYFRSSDYEDYGVVFDYSATISKTEKVEFEFTRSAEKKYVNTILRSEISEVSLPKDLTKIINDTEISLGENNIKSNEKLTSRLVSITNQQLIYDGKVLLGEDIKVTFSNVPIGIYSLQIINNITRTTVENNAQSGGIINIYFLDSQQVQVVNK